MLLLAQEDKKLQCLELQSRKPLFLFIGSDAFNCCNFLSGFLLLAETQDENIYQLDVRSPRTPVQVIHRSGAPVMSLLSFRDGFIASQGGSRGQLREVVLYHSVKHRFNSWSVAGLGASSSMILWHIVLFHITFNTLIVIICAPSNLSSLSGCALSRYPQHFSSVSTM